MNDATDPHDGQSPAETAKTPEAESRIKLVSALAAALLAAAATYVTLGFFRSAGVTLLALGVLAVILLASGRRARQILVCIVCGWVLGLMLTPALNESGDTGHRQAYCMTRLKDIANGVMMYRMENADAYPPDLNALIAANHIDEKQLVCPIDEVPGGPDYFYLPPDAPPPDDAILACDLRKNHPGRRSVVFHDTRVEHLKESDFQSLLALPQNAAFAAALRAAEGP